MTKPLSPAAKAIVDAYGSALFTEQYAASGRIEIAIAAALRAAALHLHSEEYVTCGGASYALMIEQDDLLALAEELESHG